MSTKPIPVTQKQVNGQSVQMVNARILHQFLGVEWDFSTWIKRRIKHYAFESGSCSRMGKVRR